MIGRRNGCVDVLRLLQFNEFARTLTREQVTVMSDLLHGGRVDSVSLLKDLLVRSPLVDEVGDP